MAFGLEAGSPVGEAATLVPGLWSPLREAWAAAQSAGLGEQPAAVCVPGY